MKGAIPQFQIWETVKKQLVTARPAPFSSLALGGGVAVALILTDPRVGRGGEGASHRCWSSQGFCPSQVVVWKRYSDFRKLHGDLAYTHRNLFRRLEEFPAFPRAQVFGEWQSRNLGQRRWKSQAKGTSAGGGWIDRA